MTGTPQQYCLRWNNYQNNLTNVFDQLLQSEAFVDVTLACDGESLKAHKMILSACSPYFQQLFFDNPCSHPIVILKDVRWEELKALVEFMYRGEINVNQDQLAPLLKVAELLKIRGLADVSRGSSADLVTAASAPTGSNSLTNNVKTNGKASHSPPSTSSGAMALTLPVSSCLIPSTSSSLLHPPQSHSSLLLRSPSHLLDSDSEEGASLAAARHRHLHSASLPLHHLTHPHQFHHPSASALQQQFANALANGQHHFLNSTGNNSRRKRRKVSNISDDNGSLSPSDALDDDQLEIDSNNCDYDVPSPMALLEAGLLGNGPLINSSSAPGSVHLPSHGESSPGMMPGSSNKVNSNTSIHRGGPPASSASSSSSHKSMAAPSSSSILNLHNAALAAAAAAATTNSSSSSVANDMDLKPGIREMIREEERAKMLESSHGWLGPSGASALSDSYQYQIQSLWQKCWSTNQSGMVQALRFRERGPLKSWKPETMADAIFAVLREGLSLSQAARKFDIPYPTFVLYANRVHNMLGPSSDGSSDLLSDMRPKGRGRPQRILLGSWPEDHIHGVIRAVVFRDATKDDLPFAFGRELCLPPQPGSSHSSNNGLDMSIHAPFLGLRPHRPSSFGSSNESSHNRLQVELGSRSNSPLLDDLASNPLSLDILREQREQAILRAMKKSGDDDEDDLDEEEDEIISRRRSLAEHLRSLNSNNNKRSNSQIGHNSPSRGPISNSLQNQLGNKNCSSNSPEIIHIKTEIEDNDLMSDDCEMREEDGLLISENETNATDQENNLRNSEQENGSSEQQSNDELTQVDDQVDEGNICLSNNNNEPDSTAQLNTNNGGRSSNEVELPTSTTTNSEILKNTLNSSSALILISENKNISSDHHQSITQDTSREINTPSPLQCPTPI